MYVCVLGSEGKRRKMISEDIIKRINKGDAKAFEYMYSAYYLYLRAVATKYVYQIAVAQEIVNDVFLNAWNNRTGLTYPVNAYLIKAVQNRSLNYIQRKKSQEVPVTDVQEQLLTIREELINLDEHPLAYLENKELEEMIYGAVDKLPPRCREIMEQYLFLNKSYEEIAETTGISQSTARVQVKIGLTKLREYLGDFNFFFFIFLFFSQK